MIIPNAEAQALLDYWKARWNYYVLAAHDIHDDACRRGATPEQAAALPRVRDMLTVAYEPCDEDAPTDTLPFENYLSWTIHLARLANGTYPTARPGRALNRPRPHTAPHANGSTSAALSSGIVPTGRAPDPDLWTAATMNFPKILLAATRRLELPSASEHDLSLATRLREVGWTPQQIADLLWWNRRQRGEDLKHPGYYTRTVDRAVQTVAQRKGRS
jgi:hypothetical protein